MASLETALTDPALLLGASFALGATHAFEADHLAAVSTFVLENPKPSQAVRQGGCWAIGHSASLLVFAALAFAMKGVFAGHLEREFERLVGVVLLAIGFRMGLGLWRELRGHHHSRVSLRSSGLGSLGVGLIHGLAGSAAFVGEALVVLSSSFQMAMLYTLSFSAGVFLAMVAGAFVMSASLRLALARWSFVLQGAKAMSVVWVCFLGSKRVFF